MKLVSSDFANLIRLIEKNQIKALLLYGPNQGYITTIIKQIVSKLNFNLSNHSYKNLTSNQLSMLSSSQNFFNQKEIIKIIGVTASINNDLKNFFENTRCHNLICLIAEDTLPPTGIRSFFEKLPNLVAMACYYDDEQTIGKLILQQCGKQNKNIDDDALFYLKSHLSGDHQYIKSELDKLFFYTHDKDIISLPDVHNCLSSNLLASGDEMCIYFAKKKYDLLLKEIEKLQSQNINEILMIRVLIRYFLNIYFANLRLENGESLDQSIKSITPPIFYKYVNDFRQNVQHYSSNDAIEIIQYLQQSEINYKQNSGSFDLFKILIEIDL